MNKELFDVDWTTLTAYERKTIINEFTEYTKSVQSFQQFHYTHLADMRNLVSFLLIAAGGAFFKARIETVVAIWVVPHIILTIMSKFAQIGSSIEVNRRMESLEKTIVSIQQNRRGDP